MAELNKLTTKRESMWKSLLWLEVRRWMYQVRWIVKMIKIRGGSSNLIN